jgi:hypothetical protein
MHSGSPAVAALEREYARGRGALTYAEALAAYTALWEHARALNPDFPGSWTNDIDADLELARVLNGFPSRP